MGKPARSIVFISLGIRAGLEACEKISSSFFSFTNSHPPHHRIFLWSYRNSKVKIGLDWIGFLILEWGFAGVLPLITKAASSIILIISPLRVPLYFYSNFFLCFAAFFLMFLSFDLPILYIMLLSFDYIAKIEEGCI